MPSFVDERGLGVDIVARTPLSPEHLARAVDLIIVKLRASRYRYRDIAAVLNRPMRTVQSRYRAIPIKVRRHYAALPMG